MAQEKEPRWRWEDEYKRTYLSSGPNINNYDRAIVDKYRHLQRIAEYLAHEQRGSPQSIDQIVAALASLELQTEIHTLLRDMATMHMQLMDKLEKTRSIERIVNNERVIVGDPINQLLSEVYKK